MKKAIVMLAVLLAVTGMAQEFIPKVNMGDPVYKVQLKPYKIMEDGARMYFSERTGNALTVWYGKAGFACRTLALSRVLSEEDALAISREVACKLGDSLNRPVIYNNKTFVVNVNDADWQIAISTRKIKDTHYVTVLERNLEYN